MNIYLFFNSDIVTFVLKTDGGGDGGMEGGAESLILSFLFLGCFNCWWVRCGGVGRKS